MLNLLHDKIIRFNGSILGFEQFDEFLVTVDEQGSPYAYLQSVQDESLGFLAVLPFIFYPQYTFEIDEQNKASLGLKSREDVVVLTIVTIKEPFTASTVNLLAPIVINMANSQARQVVLPPNSDYGTSERLFREAPAESGERNC